MKKLLLSCLVLSFLAFPRYANAEMNKSLPIQPLFEDVCNKKPYHNMESHGLMGSIHNAKTGKRICWGYTWQCSYCYLVMVTEGDPLIGQNIGYYAVENAEGPTAIGGAFIYTNKICHTTAKKISSYRFTIHY